LDKAERMALVLEHMVSKGVPCGVTEISKQLKISKSSIGRVLTALENIRWVDQLPDSKYAISDKLLELSLALISGLDIRKVSLPFLDELNIKTKETAALTVRADFDDICIEQSQSHNPVRHVVTMGKRLPLWTGSTGKVILANLDSNEIDEVLNNLEKAGNLVLASGQVTTTESLRTELSKSR